MNLQQLRYVVATAEHETMTAAANALRVAQPALSRSVRSLERELGVEIFARQGRGVVLTPCGALVVDLARQALRSVESIQELAGGRPGGAVVIVCTPMVEVEISRRLLPRFVAAHPRHSVRITAETSSDAVLEAVRTGRADLGITHHSGTDLRSVPLADYEILLLAPPESQLPKRLGWGELAGIPLILPTADNERRHQLDLLFAHQDLRPVVTCETDDRRTWTNLVLGGAGCCFAYGQAVDDAVQAGAQVVRLDPPLLRTVSLVYRSHDVTPAAAAFTEMATAGGWTSSWRHGTHAGPA